MELHTPNGQVPGPEVCGEAAVFLVSDAAWHIQGPDAAGGRRHECLAAAGSTVGRLSPPPYFLLTTFYSLLSTHYRSSPEHGNAGRTGDFKRLPFGLELSGTRASIRKTTTLFPGMLAQSSHFPSGVMARFCGPRPRLGSMPIRLSQPLVPNPVVGNAVVTSVRPIKKFSIRRDLQVGTVAGAVEILGQRR
jgi:hypothetical protein